MPEARQRDSIRARSTVAPRPRTDRDADASPSDGYVPAGGTVILTDDERELVLFRWNDTATDYPLDTPLHGLIEQTVRQYPDRIALEFEDEVVSYSELNSRANRLACFLRTRGVGPDVPVGLCAVRSPEMVIAILGILKAGGAYVPLDPDDPAARLSSIVADASPPMVLAQERLLGRLDGLPAPAFCIDRDWHELEHHDDSDPTPLACPADLAYIIYTSGSTGAPKGAMNTHKGICNSLHWKQDAYRLVPEDRVLQKSPFSFDISVWEFFWPLLVGARVVLASPGGHRDPSYLARLIRDAGITVLHFVPSMLQAFLEEPGLERDCRTLRHVFAGGEALPEHLARRCLDRLPARLHNLYGPTEAAVEATYQECRPDDPPGRVPIGRPIANMRTYVLDNRLQPVSVGSTGELFLAGVGVARGYLGRRDLTAERFLPDPFVNQADARMYRTGDLARWRADGTLDFLGRLDHQVKVRGFRIELGEIEATLANVPTIRQSVVVVHEFKPGDSRLVAYVVAEMFEPDAVRAHLARTLPEHMVPSAFVRLESLPLTSSGKVDRKALPAPTIERDAGTAYAPPRTPLESTLAADWRELLAVDRVGIHDDFFGLGGHSLLATRAVARAAAFLDRHVSLRTLFDAPTIASFASALNPAGQLEEPLDRIEPLADGERDREVLPSFAQQRLWFIDQLEGPGLTAYNISTATRLDGELDDGALRLALQDVVARHEPLRASFALRDGQPVVMIGPPVPLELPTHDLRAFEDEDRLAEADRLACIEADRPFDLAADVLLRATLIRTGDRQHTLLITLHHLAADGWSLAVLWRELGELYSVHRTRCEPALPSLPVRYTDYAAWQRRLLVGDRLERLLAYWRDQLRGLEPLELPADRPRPLVLSYRGDRLDFEISAPLVDRLRGLCQDAGVTPHLAMLAALQATLGRITGRHDLAVGVPVAGRTVPELDGLVGYFINTLVLRADLSGRPSFRELLARTREASLDAHDHQELPFDRLVEDLQPDRQRNRPPVVEVMFQYLEASRPDFSRAGITATPLPDPSRRVRFDLEWDVRPRDDAMTGELRYSVDLFDRSSIERLAARYCLFLEAAVAAPDAPVDDIPLLTDPERELLLVRWNDTSAEDFSRDATVHGLFRDQASRSPDAIALVFEGVPMTYAELDARSDWLARRLRGLGAGPETVVALCLPRSPAQIIAVLGILKAGAAYLPLDPANPPRRNALLLRDARAIALVTRGAMLAKLPEVDPPIILIQGLDDDGEHEPRPIGAGGDDGLGVATVATSRSLAYVLYTSGSTGEPKGVMIEHGSIVRLVIGQRYATFGPDRVFLQLAPLAFDASTFEIWGPLLHGGTLAIPPDGPVDLSTVRELIASHGVTTLWLTAGLFNEIVEAAPDALAGVGEIIAGGEALSPRHVRKAYERLGPPTRIINGYGPTECTTFACCYPIPRSDPPPTGTIPIGRPIGRTTAYVLDEARRLAPIGVAGELYLGGDGVARGYLNRAELTAERFIASPFRPDDRLYRTGDLARWLPEGDLEFLGRLDNQVKVRGFRIEPSEIEAVLVSHSGVQAALVRGHENGEGKRCLVAYWTPPPDASPDAIELRRFLRDKLPEYMVPALYVQLAEIPRTAHGKVDFRALPAPDTLRARPSDDLVAPRGELERRLVEVWQECLGVKPIGIRDNFFDLGGHSLLAVWVVAEIQKVSGIRLPLATLFRDPTVEYLAIALEKASQATTSTVIVDVQPNGSRPPLFFLHAIDGEVYCQPFVRYLGADQPVFGIQQPRVGHELEHFERLEDMAARYVQELCVRQPRGPYYLAGHSFGGIVVYEVARQLSDLGHRVGLLAILDTGSWDDEKTTLTDLLRATPAFLRNIIYWFMDDLPRIGPRELHERLHRRLKRAIRWGCRLAGHPDMASKTVDIRDRFDVDQVPAYYREVCEANLRLVSDYVPTPYPGRVFLLRARRRPLLGPFDHDLGWTKLALGGIEVRNVRGQHVSMMLEPYLSNLAGLLAAALRDSNGQTSVSC